jgi:DNA-binding XRE family transcriptional regulator
VREYSCARLAGDLDLDPMQIGRWCRGDYAPSIQKAIALVEVARRAGCELTLEEIYSRHFARIRARIRSGEPPL